MKILLTTVLLCSIFAQNETFAQKMNNLKLHTIYEKFADSLVGEDGRWEIYKNGGVMISISDVKNNRMRIIMPIVYVEELSEDELKKALSANFHSVLDAKYAISDDIMWSIFVHPLKELSQQQVEDALLQVFYASVTFGGSYSSTNLVFPGGDED
jgi:hypothetical protein